MSVNGGFLELLTHPLLLYFYLIPITAVVVGFTHRDAVIRIAILPVLLGELWLFLQNCYSRTQSPFFGAFIGGGFAQCFLQYLDVAVLSRWDFVAQGPKAETRSTSPRTSPNTCEEYLQRERNGTFLGRLAFGLRVACSCRYCGTPQEVKNVPPFDRKLPSYTPSRGSFLLGKIRNILVCYLILDALSSIADPDTSQNLFRLSNVPLFWRLNQITGKEIMVRVLATGLFWATSYVGVLIVYDMTAIAAVGLGMTDVSWWRPMFGPISEACTLRGLWGRFWHQQFRQRCGSPAMWIMNQMPYIRNNPFLYQYVYLTTVFFISALHHIVVDVASGIALPDSGVMRFFFMQPIGFAIEDCTRAYFGNSVKPTLARGIGFLWVVLWLSWVTPGLCYPIFLNNTQESHPTEPVFSPFRYMLGSWM